MSAGDGAHVRTAASATVGSADLVLRARAVATPDGVRPASVHVRDGRITRVTAYEDGAGRDLGDAVLLPGLVDTHVHINDPGRAAWEGFDSATLAAAAGGITTLVDMPLNSVPPTVDMHALAAKRAAARGRCRVDVAFWGGLVPGNAGDLDALYDAGVAGFKCFLVPSGVDEFAHVGEPELRRALPILGRLGAPLLVHAESPRAIEAASPALAGDPRVYATWLASRPPAAEVEAVEMLARLCRETGARIHAVHISAAEVIPVLQAARADGLPLTAETCPHYLHFTAEEVADGDTLLKCAPPIRGRANREALWAALADGVLDMVVSDHSPCTADLKLLEEGDFARAWGGIASLQLGLSVVWAGARTRGFGVADVVRWMAEAPARLAGLHPRKGAIAEGSDADLVAWRPDAWWRVDPADLYHRNPLTPYAGLMLPGVVEATWLGGESVYEHGEPVHGARGRLLAPGGVAWTSRA